MTKQKIVILAVFCAAAVVGGSVTAAKLAKNFNDARKNPDVSETVSVGDYPPSNNYYDPTPGYTYPADRSTTLASNPVATLKRVAKTAKRVAKGKSSNKKTGKKSGKKPVSTTKKHVGNTGLVPSAISDRALAGYRYDPEGNFYYTDDKDCWQKNAGYNEIYDKMTPLTGMFIDVVRVRFPYEGKDWMIQFWKGQYGFLMVGAEIGVYTAPEGTYKGKPGDVNHYDCAAKEDWLKMQLDCYWSKNRDGHYKKVFTRKYDRYWWATGFVQGQLTKYTAPRTELKVKARITFKSREMADLFVRGLRNAGFHRSVGENNLVDDGYFQNGADVWVLWSSISEDCFVGYEGRTTTAKPTTAKPTTTKPTTTKPTTTEPTTTKPTTTKPTTTKPTTTREK